MKKLGPSCSFALLLLVPAAALRAQQGPSTLTVTGVVGDAHTGAAIANVVVSVPALRIRTLTDAAGEFRLERVPRGEHRWVFRMLGYADWEEELALGEGEHLRVGLLPQPVALEHITVTADRLASRRKTASVSVHALAWEEIRSSVAASAADLIMRRSPAAATGCPAARTGYCIRWRGRVVIPVIYLDEQLTPVTVDELGAYPPEDIHSVEYYDFGRHVLVYTVEFMKRGKILLPLNALLRRR